eukprot:TRINITY_DN2181_c0_g2_i1.p1 TRINITY_DN2181_c0_g2~~TRINITY_DN2181_c0_g2_i1.p1  ORF type:complete len:629 (+),score=191.64 TRINITY_DN2181_c0_g2_i1:341-2227(+)
MSGAVTLETLLSDIEKAPKSAVGKVDELVLKDIWMATSNFIANKLRAGKAVKMLNFGVFTFSMEKFTSKEYKLPRFEVTEKTAINCNVSRAKRPNTAGVAAGVSGQIRVVDLNPSAISALVGCSRDVVTSALRSFILFLSDRIRMGQNVQINFGPLGHLLSRADKLVFKFKPNFIREIAGESVPDAALLTQRGQTQRGMNGASNGIRPGSRASSRAGSRASQRPGTSGSQRPASRVSASRASSRASSRAVSPHGNDGDAFLTIGGTSQKLQSRPSTAECSSHGGRNGHHGHNHFSETDARLCNLCRTRDEVLTFRQTQRDLERDEDRRIAEAQRRDAEAFAREEREKQEAAFKKRREEMQFNLKTLLPEQNTNKAKLRNEPMGDLFAKRTEPKSNAIRRADLARELDSQIQAKQTARLREREQDQLEAAAQREANERAVAEMDAKEAAHRRRMQEQQRRDLEEQMRTHAPGVARMHDAIDTNFTASEGPQQIAARKARALQLQEEQLALMASREEMKKFARKADQEEAAKQNAKTKAELNMEKTNLFSKKQNTTSELRSAWDQQIRDRALAKDLAKHGGDKTLTSLNLHEHVYGPDKKCIRCKGPLPDGYFVQKPPRRPGPPDIKFSM